MPKKIVYRVGDGWQDPDGNPVTEDGTPIEAENGEDEGDDEKKKSAPKSSPKKK